MQLDPKNATKTQTLFGKNCSIFPPLGERRSTEGLIFNIACKYFKNNCVLVSHIRHFKERYPFI